MEDPQSFLQSIYEPTDPSDDAGDYGFYTEEELFPPESEVSDESHYSDPLFVWYPPSPATGDTSVYRCNLSDLRPYLHKLFGPAKKIELPGLVIMPLSAAYRIRYDTRRRGNPPLLVYTPTLATGVTHPELDGCIQILN